MRDTDIVIIGAGLSGIGAACVLRRECPDEELVILEARDSIGGTWDLFRYPGVRSDSDMYTLGYIFKPWVGSRALAAGEAIREYVQDAAQEHDLPSRIHFGTRVTAANWSGAEQRWRVTAVGPDGEAREYRCRFLYCCAGYYNYAQGHRPKFAGEEQFAGRIVHPQHWPEDLEYAGKQVVVIGSGATAVTLVPAMARSAAKVTMLQRSPSYVMSLPAEDGIARWMQAHLPARLAYRLARWKNILLSMFFFNLSRWRPQFMRRLLRKGVVAGLGEDYPVDVHFNPRYNPWDQRLCFVPDGDLFQALRAGQAEVVTDHIAQFSASGLRLASGRELPADVVVMATGLDLQLMGGMALSVDDVPVLPREQLIYRGMMVQDLPNFAFTVGYTNASWTLKADLVASYVARLLRYMRRKGYRQCTPRLHDTNLAREPLIDFSSGYVERKRDELPAQGARAPWKLYQNYLRDRLTLALGRMDDGAMEFR